MACGADGVAAMGLREEPVQVISSPVSSAPIPPSRTTSARVLTAAISSKSLLPRRMAVPRPAASRNRR
jgi:hypothetical protein